jgi:Icc protein
VSTPPILVETDGPVRTIIINRPDKRNAVDRPTADALRDAAGEHLLVCLHHHPVPMGSEWLDTQLVGSAERFFEVIDAHPRVRGILWGHVHQEYDDTRNGVRLLAVPSTCVQFKPGSADFAVDDTSPGYRWLDLHADGGIDTAVSRVEGIHFEVDMSVKGY